MDHDHLHGDLALVEHILARLTPSQRRSVLSTVPEFLELQHARDMLRARIGHAGSHDPAGDVADLYRGGKS